MLVVNSSLYIWRLYIWRLYVHR